MSEDLFKETIKKLLEVAEKDGVITSEEFEVLEQIRVDADSYAVNLEEAKSDGTIDDTESEKLSRLRDQILERAEIVANIDGTLSDDERALLNTLKEFINKKYVID
ncbi:MAG: hypothetical protein INQ03_11815 [Candidatus Heimdallarchaeota archaeon]|nr:hypothetical protein [Candidatus Heimdallarchaeota archaeon]